MLAVVRGTRQVLGYAMAHDEIPVVSRLLMRTAHQVQGARLRPEAADGSGLLADAEEIVRGLRAGRPWSPQR